MSLNAQGKVLRALQEERSQVGADKDINVDVRVVAAIIKTSSKEVRKSNSGLTCITV